LLLLLLFSLLRLAPTRTAAVLPPFQSRTQRPTCTTSLPFRITYARVKSQNRISSLHSPTMQCPHPYIPPPRADAQNATPHSPTIARSCPSQPARKQTTMCSASTPEPALIPVLSPPLPELAVVSEKHTKGTYGATCYCFNPICEATPCFPSALSVFGWQLSLPWRIFSKVQVCMMACCSLSLSLSLYASERPHELRTSASARQAPRVSCRHGLNEVFCS